MSTKEEWFIYRYTEEQEEEAREARKAEDAKRDSYFRKTVPNWVGNIAEDAVAAVAEAAGRKDCVRQKPGAPCDFIMGNRRIDVKTLCSSRKIQPEWQVNIIEEQLTKRGVNTYIFTITDTDTRTITVLGWLSKEEFLEQADIHKKGETLNRFILQADNRTVLVKDLHPLSEKSRKA